MCLSNNSPIAKRVSIPGRPFSLIERRDLAVDPVPVDLPSQLRQLVLEVNDLVARNRWPDFVVSCFFGRIDRLTPLVQ
jgi:hypothetical protein